MPGALVVIQEQPLSCLRDACENCMYRMLIRESINVELLTQVGSTRRLLVGITAKDHHSRCTVTSLTNTSSRRTFTHAVIDGRSLGLPCQSNIFLFGESAVCYLLGALRHGTAKCSGGERSVVLGTYSDPDEWCNLQRPTHRISFPAVCNDANDGAGACLEVRFESFPPGFSESDAPFSLSCSITVISLASFPTR